VNRNIVHTGKQYFDEKVGGVKYFILEINSLYTHILK
jgi:hypothetical protein